MAELTALDDLTETPHAEVFDRAEPRTVRLQLDADDRIPGHEHPGTDVVLHLLSGRVELTLGEDTHDLTPGDLIRFAGDQEISPYAVEDSTAVLVFAPTTDG